MALTPRSAEELADRIDVEIAWFYEHCPNPDGWLRDHGNNLQAVFDYIAEFGPRGGASPP
ncbi:MAG: hypothetical protein JO345_34540 [Streptosporangiaceae bacterium]|nr:hypothetical protein [Streptosporangiaceae bacterium]